MERIYRPRFPIIRYLMPFVQLPENPDVITVYCGSYNHQGFATDAARKLVDIDCSHYIFLQDDLLLRPDLDSRSLLERLRIRDDGGFIIWAGSLTQELGEWQWMLGILWRLFYPKNMMSGTGINSLEELLSYLPPVDEAKRRLARYGIDLPVITRTPKSLADGSTLLRIPHFSSRSSERVHAMNRLVADSLYETAPGEARIEIPYPLVD